MEQAGLGRFFFPFLSFDLLKSLIDRLAGRSEKPNWKGRQRRVGVTRRLPEYATRIGFARNRPLILLRCFCHAWVVSIWGVPTGQEQLKKPI